MVNEEKVILMTKLALYEQNEGKKDIPVSRYYKGDYMSIHMIGSFFACTIAYVLGLILWVGYASEDLISNFSTLDVTATLKWAVIVYIIFLAAYMTVSFIFFSRRFKQIRLNLKRYNGNLKKLQKMQLEEQENTHSL